MHPSKTKRAQVLVEALPYIREYRDKIVVVKLEDSAVNEPGRRQTVMGDIALLSLVGIKLVLIHSCANNSNDTLNKVLVGQLCSTGVKALGLNGADGEMINIRESTAQFPGLAADFKINSLPIFDVLEKGYIPVVSTVGYNGRGGVQEVDPYAAAARIAGALSAENLLLVTDAVGILRDKADSMSLISEMNVSEVPQLIKEGVITGAMIPKANCCLEAIRRGVKRVVIIDGRAPHSILIEILTNEGIGTMFR